MQNLHCDRSVFTDWQSVTAEQQNERVFLVFSVKPCSKPGQTQNQNFLPE